MPLVDVGSIIGRDGTPVDRHLCAPGTDPNGTANPLPAHSLDGVLVLVSRGYCTFVSKAGRAQDAGAAGIVLVDNRAGEANPIPITAAIPMAMIADVDGAALRAAMGSSGRITVLVGSAYEDIVTGRSGVVTSFSSAGPTAFGHLLKPDLSAPGGQILSSTLPEFSGGSPFAVFDGTSMATPHVAGAAALLVQRHPSWSAQQIKSALMSTAGAAWANTDRTQEAAVTLEGAGLINVPRADDPQVFTNPASLSLAELNIAKGAASKSLLLQITDAGTGAGSWTVTLATQSATTGVSINVPSLITIAPGGEGDIPFVVNAAANAQPGDEMGFVVLTKGTVTRRVPYYFEVSKPALATVKATELGTLQQGDTISGTSVVSQYRFPSWPYGPPPSYAGPGVNETGAERLYTLLLSTPAINFGVSVVSQSANSSIDPFVLGSQDENDVQGAAGIPVNVNPVMYDFRANVEAGAVFPLTKRYYIAVDSGTDPFSGQSFPGQYVLKAWINDVTPPALKLLTTRVTAGRPTIVALATDAQSGIDPLSLVFEYNGNVLIGAAAYDVVSGLAVFPIPSAAPVLAAGKKKATTLSSSDFQEAKNVNTIGTNILPNTSYADTNVEVVNGPSLTWLLPSANSCVDTTTRFVVSAASTKKVNTVSFAVDKKKLGSDKGDSLGLFIKDWNPKGTKKGKHTLYATLHDAAGHTLTQSRSVRVCK